MAAPLLLSPLYHESSTSYSWAKPTVLDLSAKNVTKSPTHLSLGVERKSFTPAFIFLDQINKKSGKVDSPIARKTIRSHVMLQARKKQVHSSNKSEKTTSSKKPGTELPASGSSVKPLSELSLEHFDSSKSPVRDHRIPRERVESPCRPFYRATDAFAYAGCNVIDMRSYRFFNHYSWEFHLILCDGIQPVSPASSNLCCSAAVQENSPALLHAICFTAAAHEAAVQTEFLGPHDMFSASLPSSNTQQDAFRYKSSTLKLLSKEFSEVSRITEATILCVAMLLATEAIIGDSTGLTVHTKGLIQIIKLFGGYDRLTAPVAARVNFVDIKAAIAQQRQPLFPLCPDFHRPCAVLEISFLCPTFAAYLSLHIQHYLLLTQRLTLAAHRPASNTLSSPSSLHDFLSLEHALLSLPSSHSLTPLDNAVRIALLLYTNTALWTPPLYFVWVLALLAQLKAAILTLEVHTVGVPQYEELVLWMTFLGGYVSSATSQVEAAWWGRRLRDVVGRMGVRTWWQAREVVGEILYIENVYGEAWEEFWNYAAGGASAESEGSLRLQGPYPCMYDE